MSKNNKPSNWDDLMAKGLWNPRHVLEQHRKNAERKKKKDRSK